MMNGLIIFLCVPCGSLRSLRYYGIAMGNAENAKNRRGRRGNAGLYIFRIDQ